MLRRPDDLFLIGACLVVVAAEALHMDWTDYGFIVVAYIVASSIKGLTGIGFSTSCLPIMALRLDLKLAIPLVIVPSIISNLVVMIQAGRFREVVLRFWPLYIACIPGLIIGLTFLVSVEGQVPKGILGLVLVAYALWALSNRSYAMSDKWERILKMPAGFCNGLVNGMTGSQVMPSLPYFLSLKLDKNAFVQAINVCFTLSSLVMLFGMNRLGHLSLDTLLVAVCGLIPVIGTVYLAGRLQNRLSGTWHRRLVLAFLLVMGLVLSVKVLA